MQTISRTTRAVAFAVAAIVGAGMLSPALAVERTHKTSRVERQVPADAYGSAYNQAGGRSTQGTYLNAYGSGYGGTCMIDLGYGRTMSCDGGE